MVQFFKKVFFFKQAASVAFYWEELGEWCFSILFMIEDESNAAFSCLYSLAGFFITSLYIYIFACSCVSHGLDLRYIYIILLHFFD